MRSMPRSYEFRIEQQRIVWHNLTSSGALFAVQSQNNESPHPILIRRVPDKWFFSKAGSFLVNNSCRYRLSETLADLLVHRE